MLVSKRKRRREEKREMLRSCIETVKVFI